MTKPKAKAAPAKAPAAVKKPVVDPRESGAAAAENAARLHEGSDPEAAVRRRKVDIVDDPMVTVTVPKAFRLQHPPGVITAYAEGVQEMPTSHADHSYSKDNGVTRYVK